MRPKTTSGFGVRKLRPSGYSSVSFLVKTYILFLIFSALDPELVSGQCQLACRGKVNVSLGDSCKALITPDMLLTSGPSDCPGARYRVDVLDYNMHKIPTSPYATGDYIRMELIGMVFDSNSRNSCWTKMYIEDKYGPVIECRVDTIYCNDTMAYSTPPFHDNCDPNPTIQLLGEVAEPLDCNPRFIKKLTRYWQGRDNLGNPGKICTSMFWLRRIPIDSIKYPKHFVRANDCNLECNGQYLTDANGHPHPYVTGVPTIDGKSLWPSQMFYCNLATSYEDVVALDLPCKKKIIRLWKVIEWWCGTGVIRTYAQTIEILDTKPPVLHCPYDFTVTTAAGYQCEANVYMPPVTVHDSCQDTVHVDIAYPGGLLHDQNGGYILLKPGINRVVYVAYDGCYNQDSCVVFVTVEDKTPPVAICQQNTVVSMTRDNFVHVYAESFDDGSYDDCHLDNFTARRMDNGDACSFADTLFRPIVEFCCDDVGKQVMVIVRVTDKHGNHNDCMVNVEVQDKTPPVINCPHDVRIPCSKYNDTINLARFGEADYYDNCVVHMHQYVDSFLNQCGLGHLERVFVVRDNMGRLDSCRQRIDIYDVDPFDEHDIIWPYDYHMNSCGAEVDPKNLPDTFGYPIILANDCSLVGISYEDHQFNYVQDTALCFKILRKWKIIDWCQCYTDLQTGETKCPSWHHEQIIKVSNHLPPKIQDDCEPVKYCLSTQECLKEHVHLTHTAVDDCTPDDLLNSGFKIDLFNDGLFDTSYQHLGNVITFDGDLPLGSHRILWNWEDQCGNQIVCTQFVDIVNCKAPTAYCLNGISVNLMAVDTNGDGRLEKFIDVWAKDVDKGSYQFCGNPVTLSFSRDTNIRYIRFTCDSLGMHRSALWVTDQLTGKQDFCYSAITVQDNNRLCNTGNITANIGGLIQTPFDQGVSAVSIKLDGPNGASLQEFNGKYQFSNLLVGADYSVQALVDKNYLDGVSTLDIVKLQRHILGLETFNSPWHYLAADVTGDKRVTAADVAALRKLILGIDSKYKSNLSWSFVESTYQFPVADDPWYEPYPTVFNIAGLPGDMMYLDFKGVKVGDVSQTTWNGFSNFETRSGKNILMNMDIPEGENRMAIRAKEACALNGCQFTLRFNPQKAHLIAIRSGLLHIEEDQIGWNQAANGYVLVSWNVPEPVTVNAGEVLFYLEFDRELTKADGQDIDMNSDILNAEAYGEGKNIYGIELSTDAIAQSAEVLFGDPVPNPFTQSTQLKFFLRQAAEVIYSVSDLNGRMVYYHKSNYHSGQNVVTIKKDQLSGSGVYVLKMESGDYTKSMKLVLIE